MTISMKREKTIEEVVAVVVIITIINAIMTIAIEIIKIETGITIVITMKEEIVKIVMLESIKIETMETDNTKEETITIKIINPETEKIIASQEMMIINEEMEERKSTTPKINPERKNPIPEINLPKKIKIRLNQAILSICLTLTVTTVKVNEGRKFFNSFT